MRGECPADAWSLQVFEGCISARTQQLFFGTFFIFHMLGITIPTDFHIFKRGRSGRSITNQILSYQPSKKSPDLSWSIHPPPGRVWQFLREDDQHPAWISGWPRTRRVPMAKSMDQGDPQIFQGLFLVILFMTNGKVRYIFQYCWSLLIIYIYIHIYILIFIYIYVYIAKGN